MDQGDKAGIIVLLIVSAFVIIFLLILEWPSIAKAEKIDIDDGVYPTTKDAKGFYHLQGWAKNTSTNETDTDFSVEMTFAGGHFYKFFLGGDVNAATKVILPPGQTIVWDHATKAPFAGKPYNNMIMRYNEVPFPPLKTSLPEPPDPPAKVLPKSVPISDQAIPNSEIANTAK